MDTIKALTHTYLLPKGKGNDFILDWRELPLNVPFVCDHRDVSGYPFALRTEMELYLPPGFPVVISERTRPRKMYMLFIPETCYGEIEDNGDGYDVLFYLREKGTDEEQKTISKVHPCTLPLIQIPGLDFGASGKNRKFEVQLYASHNVNETTFLDLINGIIYTDGKIVYNSVLEFFQHGIKPLTITY
jgi:hypothetical protein